MYPERVASMPYCESRMSVPALVGVVAPLTLPVSMYVAILVFLFYVDSLVNYIKH